MFKNKESSSSGVYNHFIKCVLKRLVIWNRLWFSSKDNGFLFSLANSREGQIEFDQKVFFFWITREASRVVKAFFNKISLVFEVFFS